MQASVWAAALDGVCLDVRRSQRRGAGCAHAGRGKDGGCAQLVDTGTDAVADGDVDQLRAGACMGMQTASLKRCHYLISESACAFRAIGAPRLQRQRN